MQGPEVWSGKCARKGYPGLTAEDALHAARDERWRPRTGCPGCPSGLGGGVVLVCTGMMWGREKALSLLKGAGFEPEVPCAFQLLYILEGVNLCSCA